MPNADIGRKSRWFFPQLGGLSRNTAITYGVEKLEWCGYRTVKKWRYVNIRYNLSSLIAKRRHSLFGHDCRLPKYTPASQALQLSIIDPHTGTPPAADWKRPPGRPRRTWLQQVEEDYGISIGLAQITSQDFSLWRSLRLSAGQAQQWVTEFIRFERDRPTDRRTPHDGIASRGKNKVGNYKDRYKRIRALRVSEIFLRDPTRKF